MNMRVPVEQPCTLRTSHGEEIGGVTQDLSFEGAYVATAADPPQPRLQLELETYGRVLPAMVVRRDPAGVAVSFGDYDAETEHALAALIANGFSRSVSA